MYDCGAIYLFLIVLYKPILIPGMILSSVQKLGCDWFLQWVLLPREFGTVIIHYGIPFWRFKGFPKRCRCFQSLCRWSWPPHFQVFNSPYSEFAMGSPMTTAVMADDHCIPFCFRRARKDGPRVRRGRKFGWIDTWMALGLGIAANLEWHILGPRFLTVVRHVRQE